MGKHADPTLLTPREAAKLLNVPHHRVLNMIHRRELPAFKVGSQWRIYKIEVTKAIGHRIEELPREMATLNPGDPERAKIVSEIIRLRDLLKEN
ncbi:MAG TPA: helix-turn-helix domain-containing protein [Pyrinomonadaceae bacterium]|nr:helix-turn-helix domain-containing protein [Pyrinomonadaceae bacterium]